MKNKVKIAFFSFVLMLTGVISAVLLVEISGRIFSRFVPEFVGNRKGLAKLAASATNMMQEDPELMRICKPGVNGLWEGHPDFTYHLVTTGIGDGRVGFRNDKMPAEAYGIALGDSFTFGVGVEAENGWVKLLEKKTGKDFVNLAQSGECIIQYNYILKKYGLLLKPRIIIAQFFVNDILEAAIFSRMKRPTVVQVEKRPWNKALMSWLWQNSITFGIIRMIDVPARERIGGQLPYKDSTLDLVMNTGAVELLLNPKEADWQLGLSVIDKNLAELKAEAAKRSIPLVILLVPMKEQVYSDKLEKVYHVNFDLFRAQKDLVRLFVKHGIEYLDLTPIFTQTGKSGKQLYFKTDAHWNNEGNALCADKTYLFLRELKLIN